MLTDVYKLIAHRGLHEEKSGVPENSMPAFRRAAEAGYAIELDVRLSRDGKPMVFHDDGLARMTGETGAVGARTAEELQALKLSGTNYTIPLLSEVLNCVAGRVPILIEIKNPGLPGRTEQALVQALKGYHGMVVVESFNPLTVWWLRKHAPKLIRGQLACRIYEGLKPGLRTFLLRHMLFNCIARPQFIAYRLGDITERLSRLCRRKRIPLFGWTARTCEDATRAEHLCDGIIFERIRPRLGIGNTVKC